MRIRIAVAGLALALLPPPLPAEEAHFHHVHINAVEPQESIDFYEKIFGAVEVEYAERTAALFVERSFILFDQVDTPAPSTLESALWHIGWGGIDGTNEAKWLAAQGVRFEVEPTRLGSSHYMYLLGPDDELVEIFTGERNHRFNHVHLFATDVNATTGWFERHLGLAPRAPAPVEPRERGGQLRWGNSIRVDNVSIVVFGLPEGQERPPWWPETAKPGQFAPTHGRVIDHIAFSVHELDPLFARMKAEGAEIVEPVAERADLGTRSFFALAPDGLLVEVVEAKPIPDAAWE
jgi:catechol 2,3-dioxygenase-like lactoylglutathione lyase family enzyme